VKWLHKKGKKNKKGKK